MIFKGSDSIQRKFLHSVWRNIELQAILASQFTIITVQCLEADKSFGINEDFHLQKTFSLFWIKQVNSWKRVAKMDLMKTPQLCGLSVLVYNIIIQQGVNYRGRIFSPAHVKIWKKKAHSCCAVNLSHLTHRAFSNDTEIISHHE